jgi:hypothetical protein
MPTKITDPDFLVKDTEISFLSGSRRIRLNRVGNLGYEGVTLQAIYSKCKELWITDNTLVPYPFPLISITEKKFDFVNGWDFTGSAAQGVSASQQLIRDAGWSVKNAANASTEEWMGFVSLGTLNASDQVYIQQASSGSYGQAPRNVTFTGSVNEPVKIYGSASFDFRNYFKAFVRTQGSTYDQSQLSNIGESSVTYQVYSFPLTDGADTNISATDNTIETTVPYTGMSIKYYTGSVWRDIGGTTYPFFTIVDGNQGSIKQIYEFVQYKLRQNSNINAGMGDADSSGSIIGKTADQLMNFVGATLVTSKGVFIDDFQVGDTNNLQFYDTGSVPHTFPFVAAGTITFNTNLQNDAAASYKMFFTSVPSGSFGSASAVVVNDNNGFPITGSVNTSASVSFTFDYDFNIQGGRTKQTDANVTLVAIGLSTGQYVSTEGTIIRSSGNAFSLVSALERNYSNPA